MRAVVISVVLMVATVVEPSCPPLSTWGSPKAKTEVKPDSSPTQGEAYLPVNSTSCWNRCGPFSGSSGSKIIRVVTTDLRHLAALPFVCVRRSTRLYSNVSFRDLIAMMPRAASRRQWPHPTTCR